jgi:hypothetical protein
MKRVLAALTVLTVCVTSLLSSSCDNSGSDSGSTTAPTTPIVTENFTGTVDPSGVSINQFTVTNSGYQVNVILTAAGPPTTIYEGLGVGSYANGTCTLLTNGSALVQAGSTAQLSGTVNAGAYCVEVFDAGNQTAQITYAVTVTHY